MPRAGHMMIFFSEETRDLMERLLPAGERAAFVDRAVLEALRLLAHDRLRGEMAECACEMQDEIVELQRSFTPLEEELHSCV
jgi:hypothetical protein